jgi:hypothetical protein
MTPFAAQFESRLASIWPFEWVLLNQEQTLTYWPLPRDYPECLDGKERDGQYGNASCRLAVAFYPPVICYCLQHQNNFPSSFAQRFHPEPPVITESRRFCYKVHT